MKKFKQIAATVLAICMTLSIFALTACGGEKDSVTITYDTEVAGLTVPSVTSKPGSKIYPPADPTRDGYRFEGWSLDGEEFIFDVMPSKDITLKAIWNKLYAVSFVTGAEALDTEYYTAGEELDLPTPQRAHYKFTGWLLDGQPFESETMPASDIELTATWEQAVTITFKTGVKGVTVQPIVETAGTKISAPLVNRPGYHVRYWTLNGTRYDFKTMPAEDIELEAVWSEELTNLPALFIDLTDANGNEIPLGSVQKTYVDSTISLTNTQDEYLLTALKSEFKGRGNGSWNEPKKGYKIKFDKKQSLFGRAANKHWVIIACANFDDPTMSRNYLAYNMAGEVFDAIEYSTNAVWVDIYVNGEYRGVYILCEHVRVGTGRVDIESGYGVQDTGYLVEYDAYGPNDGEEGVFYFHAQGVELKYPFSMKSPDPEDYLEEGISKAEYQRQVKYIQDYVSNVYKAALSKDYATFSELADVDSFVDMYILHELFKNIDTGYSSFFLYKKPGGKLYAGPPWDFDGTTNGDDGNGRGDRTPQGLYVADANRTGSEHTKSELYIALYQTAGFKNAVETRWKTLSPKITAYLDKTLNDSVYEMNRYAMGKNYVMWKNKTQAKAEQDWIKDTKILKQWLNDRTDWLDGEWRK